MKSSILTFFLSLIFGTTLVQGAVINVGAGESIQTAINNATAGDMIQLTAPGNYPGDLNITKPISLRSLQRNYNTIVGQVTVMNLQTEETVRFKNLSIPTKLNIIGSSVDIIRCDLNELNATNPNGADCQLTILQSNISAKLTSQLSQTWVGYSDLRENYFEGKVELVGNDINGESLGGIGVDLVGENTHANIHNNLIHHFSITASIEECIGIRIDANASATIRNNHIFSNINSQYKINLYYQTGIGILVKSTKNTLIEANTFSDNIVSNYGWQGTKLGSLNIYTHSDRVSITRNAFKSNANFVTEVRPLGVFGVSPHESITNTTLNDTEFLSSTTGLALNQDSQNAGPPDPIHFDHDGSRNDIGPNGGRNYIPNGRATDKPIPIFFTIEPQVVPTNGKVTINSTGAVLK